MERAVGPRNILESGPGTHPPLRDEAQPVDAQQYAILDNCVLVAAEQNGPGTHPPFRDKAKPVDTGTQQYTILINILF